MKFPYFTSFHRCVIGGTAVFSAASLSCSAVTVRLGDLNLGEMTSGWGTAQKDQSVTKTPLSVGKVKFEHGVGVHARSEFWLRLDGKVRSFTAKTGVDDNAGSDRAAVEFTVYGDGQELWDSGICKLGGAAHECRVDLSGIKLLRLSVSAGAGGIDYDHADWADAILEYDGSAPITVPAEEAREIIAKEAILTPTPPNTPRINGPKVYGAHVGTPFLYRIPCTGVRPVTFSAKGLPQGLTLDPHTGIIQGSIPAAGEFNVTLSARNSAGETTRPFKIVAGSQLALTPPMGWNSWYIHYARVSEAAMRQAADQMIASGMADFGYQYVNCDDCWAHTQKQAPYRDGEGNVLPNDRFPDIKGMVDYIHSKGLKAGTYTSPGPWTCAGYTGAYGHEAADALQFANWGFDFLKYDWCSYGSVSGPRNLDNMKKPYQLMWAELQKQHRDIVFNLCQYGMGDVWKWGGDVGHCWRTTGDLGLERGSALPGFYQIGFSNAQHWENARPGAWNDPDYLLIGWVGDANAMGPGKPTTLTPDEQYSYMSMWSLMAAPLIFSGDMAKLDPFTINVLCNAEVIDVDQDSLGRQARILRKTQNEFVLVKDLEDGSKAIGLFNLQREPVTLSVSWSDLQLSGKQMARDLWQQKDVGNVDGQFEVIVHPHGVVLIRLTPAAKSVAAH